MTLHGDLHFIDPNVHETPTVHYTGTAEPQRYNAAYRWYSTPIQNGRLAAERFKLEQNGFELAAQSVDPSVFESDDRIREAYYPAVEQLLLERTGAARVFVFDHTVRRGRAGSPRKPAHHVHNDYTERTGATRVHDEVSAEALEPYVGRRMIQINVWRSIAGTVYRSPLAFADAGSVAFDDLVPAAIHFPENDHVGEIYALKHNPTQRWVYFPEMTANEVLLIKGFDTDREAMARFTPHTAFELKDVPEDAPPRESIETRTFLFF